MKSVMKKKFVWMVMLGMLITGRSYAQDTTTLSGTVTLEQCISLAIKNNLQVNESGFTAETDQVNLQQAKGNYLPTLSANINHSLSEGRVINVADNSYATQSSTFASYQLSLGYTLWNAGSIRNYVASSQYASEAGKMDLQQQKDNITINVILQYIQVLSDEEQLSAAKQQVSSYKEQVDKTQNMADLGALSNPAVLTDLKGNMASSELNVISIQKSLESAKIALTQYLNIPYTKDFELQKIQEAGAPLLYDVTADVIYQQALNSLAYIKSGHFKTLSAAKSLKSYKGQMWPTISFGASASSNASSLTPGKVSYFNQLNNNFGSSFGIGVYIPVLNGLQLKSNVNRARISLKRAIFEENSNKTALQQNVEQAYLNMKSGYESYQKYEDQVNNFGESARIAQVRFNQGVTTSVEYIIAKTSFDAATLNLIATKYDYILRTKILDYYQGKITFQ